MMGICDASRSDLRSKRPFDVLIWYSRDLLRAGDRHDDQRLAAHVRNSRPATRCSIVLRLLPQRPSCMVHWGLIDGDGEHRGELSASSVPGT